MIFFILKIKKIINFNVVKKLTIELNWIKIEIYACVIIKNYENI